MRRHPGIQAVIETPVMIINALGLHARAASQFVARASKFASEIQLDKSGQTVNGKSIMGVMMLAAPKGTALTLIVSGDDEQQATQCLKELIADRFGEDE